MKKFIFNRTEIATEFICSRCKGKKKSKNTAKSEDGTEVLCNGCFGLLLLRKEITRQ
ncbi:MAG: hypothetical protein KAJ14_11225 [Candidatus Omnitrophica bacterium]|nr:hypothetical protein [Candidatus Omnitrophota bacterium]